VSRKLSIAARFALAFAGVAYVVWFWTSAFKIGQGIFGG
jgi:hypothetical protein